MADFDSSLPVRTESPGDIDIFISDSITPTQKLKVNSDGSITTHLKDGSGDDYTSSNPLPVEFFDASSESFDYHTASAVAANATTTHTFSAPTNFKVKKVYVSGSGKLRAELKIDGVTVAVGFNSTASPQVAWSFGKGLSASGVNVEVEIENKDKQDQALYSTIIGQD